MARRSEYATGSIGFAERLAPLMPFRSRSVVLSIALLASLAVGLRTYAQSGNHGEGHAENHDWYKELKQPGTNMSCCNGTMNGIEGDCRPTRAYVDDNGTWRALMDGKWVIVPPRVVLQSLAPDGGSHICANRTGTIYCFMGGSPKS
jgi:hypothetical protein